MINRLKLNSTRGFTLVEIVVVAPIIILVIGAFVAAIVSVTGDVLSSRDSNMVAYNIQDTLTRIKQDVSLSDGFLAANNIDVVSPQGYDNSTQGFTNVNSDPAIGPMLILNMSATDKNPLSPDRKFIYAANQPNSCTSPQSVQNLPLIYNVVYFLRNKTLWRRVLVPQNFASLGCGTPWQKSSCDPSISDSFCKSEDVKLVENIQTGGLTINYYLNPSATAASAIAVDSNKSNPERQSALQTYSTVEVSIKSDSTSGGRSVSQTESARATTNNLSFTSLLITSQPGNQTVNSGSNATFTAASSKPSASVQWQRSTDRGATWADISGATSNTLTVSSCTNVMDGYLYRAVYTSGTDVVISNSARLSVNQDSWTSFSFVTSSGRTWSNYNNSAYYNSAGYRKTTSGVVLLKGLIELESGTPVSGDIIATLPESYRPSGYLIFSVATSTTGSARIDITPGGNVIYRNGSTAWMSLEGIHFIPNNGRYNPTNLNILDNNWVNYGNVYTRASYVVDSLTRVHTAGLVKSGTTTDNTLISKLPSSLLPAYYYHIASIVSSSEFGSVGVSVSGGGLVVKPSPTGSPSGYTSLNTMFHPATITSGWNNLSLQNSWVRNGTAYTPPEYRKDSDGLVSVRGLIRSGTTTDETIIANLPAGYRPIQRMIFAQDSNQDFARIDVKDNGDIVFKSGSNTWLSLDNIVFYAEQ